MPKNMPFPHRRAAAPARLPSARRTRRGRLAAAVAAAAPTVGFLAEALEGRTLFAAQPATVDVVAAADAPVRDGGYADRNFGTGPNLAALAAGEGFNQEAHLRFDLVGVPAGTVGRAVLRVYGAAGGSRAAADTVLVTASPTAPGTWSETGISWDDRPADAGDALAAAEVGGYGWYEWDVTSHVAAARRTGRSDVGVVLRAEPGASPQVLFSSKEGSGFRPHLSVDATAGPATRPPVPVPVPVPVPSRLRVMPLGDSITAGSGGGAYRRRLLALLAAEYPGRALDFVGTASDRASAPLPDRNHEGHGGYTIGALMTNLDGDDGRWNNGGGHWLTGTVNRPAIYPAVMLLHAGTNDVPDPVTPAGLRDRLDDLVEKIATLRPDARLLVADPIVRADAAERKSAAFGALIPALVAKHVALGRKVTFVDMHSRLTTADLYDGLHPNATGEDKMADAWAAAIKAAVPPGAGG